MKSPSVNWEKRDGSTGLNSTRLLSAFLCLRVLGLFNERTNNKRREEVAEEEEEVEKKKLLLLPTTRLIRGYL